MKTVTALFTGLLATSLCTAISLCANAASPPPPIKTSFDCASARASIEKLICRDPQLTQMDIELTRLYHLALTDERSVPPPDKVTIDQQFWIESRNQCGSGPEPKACAIRSYAERAHQLRQGSAIVRTKDPDRLTEGPLAFRCTGFNPLIAATFFNTQPGVVYLKWANTSITLSQVPSDSGARYTGKDNQGNYSFWQNGNEVLFQKPGSGAMSCTAEPVG
ncbi:MliC family protein [Pseudomonas sp. 10S4]|uniref:MliC family protein n=1 Tax=Pseudomonas sp. 10S4 TaxID=3048583 RepID=UPI002AC8F02A|nr:MULTISPECIES: MliC family protein [unclassified Pseudomonas]MEB0225741.1 MliC family protein [Pseudomonas sp. 5S1]MEB0296777.1 MliC family protein [Pseudomonas sp. 10S4]WPX17340.1 MliC family protein [Pseudomonas sp. 10S4]